MIGIDLFIIVAFLVITLLLGLSHGKKTQTFRDYALGRDMSVFVLACSLVATLSHAKTLNTIALIYRDGFSGVFNNAILLFMIYLGAKLFIIRMTEFFGDFSIAESMGKLYGPIVRKITALAILILLLSTLVTQLKVTLDVVRFALPELPHHIGHWLALVTALVMILYAALGGAKSVAITDVLQFLCFGCAFPVIGYLLLRHAKIPLVDGWAHFKQLPQFTDIDHIFSFQVLKAKAMVAVTPLFVVFAPLAIQRVYMAQSLQQGKKAVLASVAARACILGSLFCLAVLLHLGGHVLKPGEDIIGYIIGLVQSPAVRGILGVTVLALLMSTVDSALHLLSVVVVNDILPPSLFVGKSGDAKRVQVGRLCIVAVGMIALFSALVYKGNIYTLITKGVGIYVPMVAVPFAMAILGFRVRKAVALAAMVVTGIYSAYVSYYNVYADYSNSPIIAGLATSVVFSVCMLVIGHYIFPQLPHTGWVGIKDRTAVMLQNQETKHWWMQQLHNFKMLFTKQYREDLFPKKGSSFIILGAYFICSTLLALCFMQKGYFFPYIYWYMAVMAIGTILVIYPSFDLYSRRFNFMYLVWPVVLFMLFFVFSIQFAKLGHFSPMVCALIICNLAASLLFFSLKVSMGMFVAAIMLHAFMPFGVPFGSMYWVFIEEGLSWELIAASLLIGSAATGFVVYKYLYDRADAKDKVIELARTYERRASLEAIYNQVNWHRLDPTHGSAMLQEMGKMLEEPCQYLYAHKQEKLGEGVSAFMKKLREFSSLLLQRAKEERSLKLNKRAVKSVAIEPVIFKARSDIRSLEEPMQLLLRSQTKLTALEVDPALFERLLTINFLAINNSKQALDAIVNLTIIDTTLRYDYAQTTQLGKSAHTLPALAFCISTHAKPERILPVYDVIDEATPVYLPKAEAQLYQAESRQIIQAHGGYIEIIETKEKLTCLYVLPVAGKSVMHFKTYDPTDLASEVAETPESLVQEKELVTLLAKETTLTKEVVEKTIAFIKNAHGLIKRKSGEPYYTHPMAVAKILLDATKDPDTILAGLLHDVVEDTPVTLNQIQVMYGPQVAYIVDMVTHYNTNGYRWKLDEDENRSLLYQCKDIRVVYVKLADRLHNTQTLCFRNLVDQKRIAKETMTFYIPWGKSNNIAVWLSDMRHICEEILDKKVANAI